MSVDSNLRVAIFWVAALLCVIAEFAILRSMLRGSRARPASSPSDAIVPRGRPVVELVWAIAPAIGLIIVLALTRSAIR